MRDRARDVETRGRSLRTVAAACIGAVALTMAACAPARASDKVPDWVKQAAEQKLPEFPEWAKAAVLLDDETYTVGTDGRATVHERMVMKILRPQGRDLAVPVVHFDKDSKVLSMHAWSIDPAGHEYAAKDNEIVEMGSWSGEELYSDDRYKIADPPGRDPGGIVAWEYEQRERPYLAETDWSFQSELPEVDERFTLVLPQGFTYTTSWANHAKMDGADLENHSYRWELTDVPGIDLDRVPLAPAAESLAGRMAVHYAGPTLAEPQDGTWQGVGEWYSALSKDRLVATPEIAAKAAELTAGKTDFYDKAKAIGDFVQGQIRYVAIEIGIGGNQPHAAADVFRGRYGDCKDKATLLSAMLSSVGIHSALVMVDSQRGVVDPEDPSIVGNHVIAAIEIPKGYESPKMHSVVTAKTGKRYLIFDPTWEVTPFGQVEDNLQGSYGVLIEGTDSQAIQIPVMDPTLDTVQRRAELTLGADGSLKGTVTVKRYGDVSEYGREVFLRADANKQQEYMDRSFSGDLMSATLTDLKVENVSALDKELTTTFALSAQHFASNAGTLLMMRPRVFGTYTLPMDRKERKLLINLGQTMQGTDEFDIQLPAGYVVDELPDPVKVDVGFASYESSTEVNGQTLHYKRTFTMRAVTLPPEKYPELEKLEGIIEADENGMAVLRPGTERAGK